MEPLKSTKNLPQAGNQLTTFERMLNLFIREKVWPERTPLEVYEYLKLMALTNHMIILKGKKKVIGATVWYLNEVPEERAHVNQHNIDIGRFLIADGLVIKPRYRNRPKMLLRLVRESLKGFKNKEAMGFRRLKRGRIIWHKMGGNGNGRE